LEIDEFNVKKVSILVNRLFQWQPLWSCQKLRNNCMEPNGVFRYYEWKVSKYCGFY